MIQQQWMDGVRVKKQIFLAWIEPLNPRKSLYRPSDSKSLVDKSIKVSGLLAGHFLQQ